MCSRHYATLTRLLPFAKSRIVEMSYYNKRFLHTGIIFQRRFHCSLYPIGARIRQMKTRRLWMGQARRFVTASGASAVAAFTSLASFVYLGAIYSMQDKLVYFPLKDMEQLPSHIGLDNEDVWFETDDGTRIHSWLLSLRKPHASSSTQTSDSANIILFLHGNAGNISHRLMNAKMILESLNKGENSGKGKGWKIMLLSYRGYGMSEGKPNKQGLELDAQAAYKYLSQIMTSEANLFVFGRSLGGAVALSLASHLVCSPGSDRVIKDIDGLIIENSFTSISDIVDVHFPFLSFFKFLIREDWDNQGSLSEIRKAVAGANETAMRVPKMLFISGRKDEIVPFHMMDKLYEEAQNAKAEAVKIDFEAGSHNETWLQEDYFNQLAHWLHLHSVSKKSSK